MFIGLKSELQSLNSSVSQERLDLLAKEQDLHQKISIERQHFWKQTRELNQEKWVFAFLHLISYFILKYVCTTHTHIPYLRLQFSSLSNKCVCF